MAPTRIGARKERKTVDKYRLGTVTQMKKASTHEP
jgi:hypothetical protein